MDMYGVLVSRTIASKDVMLPSASSAGFTLGRKGDHRIAKQAAGVSKLHCKFSLSPSGTDVIVHDMSVNGTFIDGHLIGRGKSSKILEGQRVSLGVSGEKDLMYDESTSVVFEYHYLLNDSTGNGAAKKALSKQEKVAKLKQSRASARFATADDLNRMLQRGNSYNVRPNASPEEISTLIKVSPSPALFSVLRDRIRDECSQSWLSLFVEIGGLEQLGDVIRYNSSSDGVADVFECIDILCGYPFGVEMAIDASGFVNNLALGLDHKHSSVRQGIYELLAKIAIHSVGGHTVVLEAVNKRGSKLSEGRQFLSLVRALSKEVDPLFKSSILTLINHLCNFPNLHPKVSTALRRQFMKLGILDIFAGFGISLDCGSLDQQIGLFIDHIEGDAALKKSLSTSSTTETGTAPKVVVADPSAQKLAEKLMHWIQNEATSEQISSALNKGPGEFVSSASISAAAASVASEERQRFQKQMVEMVCEHTQQLEMMKANYESKLRKAVSSASTIASVAPVDQADPSTPVSKVKAAVSLTEEAPDSPFDPILTLLSSPYGTLVSSDESDTTFVPPPAPPPPSTVALKAQPGRFRPKGKTRQLYWTRVASNKVSGTVFDRLGWQDVEIDEQATEKLFGIAAPKKKAAIGASSATASVVAPKGPVRYFNDQRSNNIGIMMSKFKGAGGAAAVREYIINMDDTKLDIDRVTQLRQLAPDSDEEALLKSYTGKLEDLGKVEKFFLTLLSVPRLRSRLDCFIFRLRFEEVAEAVEQRLVSALSACQEALGSAALRELLRTVLAYGNFLNTSASTGFDISFLSRMSDTKSTDRNSTFLHYISGVMEETHDGTFSAQLADELPSVEAASKCSANATIEEVNALSSGLNLILREIKLAQTEAEDAEELDCFVEKMTVFYREAKDKLRYLQAYVASLKKSYAQLQHFFCISTNDTMEATMGMLTETMLRLESAHKDNLREKMMVERAEARKQLRKENSLKLASKKLADDQHKEINILDEIRLRRGMQSGRSLKDVNK